MHLLDCSANSRLLMNSLIHVKEKEQLSSFSVVLCKLKQVCYQTSSVINIGVVGQTRIVITINPSGRTFGEWIRNHAVARLEAKLGLEAILTNSTHHL